MILDKYLAFVKINELWAHILAYANTNKSHLKEVKDVILKEFRKLQKIDDKSLQDAKTYLEGDFFVGNEEGVSHCNLLTIWELAGDAKLALDYITRIKQIKKQDVKSAAKKCLNENYCLTVLEPKSV